MGPDGEMVWVLLLVFCGYVMNNGSFEKVSYGGLVLGNA